MRRFFTYVAVVAMALMTLASCSEEKRKKALLPNVSGKAGEVIVVIGQNDWEGAIGTTLRDSLSCDFPQLPQREPMFTLVNVPQAAFNNMFQIHRNIIIINVNSNVTEPGVIYRNDVWAAPQCVIRVNAPDSEMAVELLKENNRTIVGMLEEAERDRMIRNARKYEQQGISQVVDAMIGGSPHFPSGYRLKKKTDDFIWVAYEIQYVTQGIFIYKYPVVEGENMLDADELIAKTNETLKNNVPGMFENTYMTISSFVKPTVEYMRYKGLDFAEMRGFWEVYNDYMGGPFVSHSFYSQDGKDVIVLLGFVYAPKYDKRQYLRQVESVIYSFEWKNNEE